MPTRSNNVRVLNTPTFTVITFEGASGFFFFPASTPTQKEPYLPVPERPGSFPKRNRGRFPPDFAFQLTRQEFSNLISQIAISNSGHGGVRKFPWVFTEHGAVMAANLLRNLRKPAYGCVRVFRFDLMPERGWLNESGQKGPQAHTRGLPDHGVTAAATRKPVLM